MTKISHHLQLVHDRINAACIAVGRKPESVQLMAVSKNFGAGAVVDAVQAGQLTFGENYIAEGVEKIEVLGRWQSEESLRTGLASPALVWHCIGPIQSNKTRLVAEHFDWAQSVDRLKIAQRLSEQRPPEFAPLNICLQVNIDGGANKSGLAPQDVQVLAEAVSKLPRLVLRGLMAIPEPATDFVAACALHESVRALFDQINDSGTLTVPMDTLSLGMTADLEAAIHAGSTMVRVGTAIFGGR